MQRMPGPRATGRPRCAKVSVPAVIPDLDHAICDADREDGYGLVGRWGQNGSGSDAESRPVSGAGYLVPAHGPTGELLAVVGADIFQGVELAADVELVSHVVTR